MLVGAPVPKAKGVTSAKEMHSDQCENKKATRATSVVRSEELRISIKITRRETTHTHKHPKVTS